MLDKKRSALIIICFTLCAGGILLLWFGLFCSVGLISAIGESLLVAGVLGMSVDWYVKERFAKGVMEDAVEYLMGYGLPGALQARIRQVMLLTLVRHAVKYRYELRSTDRDWPTLYVEYEFRIRNYSPEEQEYEHIVSLEDRHNPRMIRLTCQSSDSSVEFVIPGNQLKQERVEDVTRFKAPPVRLCPAGTEPDIWYKFAGSYEVSPRDQTELLAFGTAVQDITVEARFPLGWRFESASMHKPSSRNKSSEYAYWRFDQAFLRAEHLRFWWAKIES
jgi:hypothetical protein